MITGHNSYKTSFDVTVKNIYSDGWRFNFKFAILQNLKLGCHISILNRRDELVTSSSVSWDHVSEFQIVDIITPHKRNRTLIDLRVSISSEEDVPVFVYSEKITPTNYQVHLTKEAYLEFVNGIILRLDTTKPKAGPCVP